MMPKRIAACMLSMALIALAGCYSQKEPKDLAILVSVLYDKADENMYSVTAEFMGMTGSSKANGSQTYNIIDTDRAASAREALTNMTHYIEESLYAGHAQARFFSETIAQNEADMAQVMDFVTRDHLTDETANIIVVKGTDPRKIYSASLGESATLGMFITAHERNRGATGSMTVFPTALDFIKDYYIEGKEPISGVIETIEYQDPSDKSPTKQNASGGAPSSSPKTYKLSLEGLAAFRGLKFVGYLDGQDARAYNFLTNNLQTAIITIPYKDGEVVLEVHGASCKIKTKMENGEAKLDISLKISLHTITFNCNADLLAENVKKDVEGIFNSQMQTEIVTAIQKAQGYMTDIFGFGQQLHNKEPGIWHTVRDQWNELFGRAQISVSVNAIITSTGQIMDSVLWEDTK